LPVCVFRRTLEMTISREEFLRLLPGAVPSFEVEGETFRWSEGGRHGTIRLVPIGDVRVGRVAVPRHRVEIVLQTPGDEEGEAFFDAFRRAFLRGGG
jgi:hypothetical protein